MIEKIRAELEKLSKREKVMFGITIFVLLSYCSYILVFESTFKRIYKTVSQVAELKLNLEKKPELESRLETLRTELEKLHATKKKKEEEEKSLDESMTARNQINKILEVLEETARKLSIELEQISVKTNVITKSSSYAEEQLVIPDKPVAEGEEPERTVRVTYTHNKISLSCRSSYDGAINYLNKVKELPYAISIISANIYKEDPQKEEMPADSKNMIKKARTLKKTRRKYRPGMLTTDLEMEIFFK